VAGSITTTFSNGTREPLAFSTRCGDATLTTPGGVTERVTLLHCL